MAQLLAGQTGPRELASFSTWFQAYSVGVAAGSSGGSGGAGGRQGLLLLPFVSSDGAVGGAGSGAQEPVYILGFGKMVHVYRWVVCEGCGVGVSFGRCPLGLPVCVSCGRGLQQAVLHVGAQRVLQRRGTSAGRCSTSVTCLLLATSLLHPLKPPPPCFAAPPLHPKLSTRCMPLTQPLPRPALQLQAAPQAPHAAHQRPQLKGSPGQGRRGSEAGPEGGGAAAGLQRTGCRGSSVHQQRLQQQWLQ